MKTERILPVDLYNTVSTPELTLESSLKILYVKDGENYLRYLTDDEFSVLQKTESYEDEYTDMWKTFFHAISIEQRKNYVCQRNLFPIWKRKHAVEFR